jgi:membrane protein implicated in regulation of membrane protease activity
MNWRLAIPLAAAGGLLSLGLLLSTAIAGGSPPSVTVAPSVRPFDPRTDRLATDSTPELNLAGRPGVVLPNLCEQRARSGFGGQPWTVSCSPAPTP